MTKPVRKEKGVWSPFRAKKRYALSAKFVSTQYFGISRTRNI